MDNATIREACDWAINIELILTPTQRSYVEFINNYKSNEYICETDLRAALKEQFGDSADTAFEFLVCSYAIVEEQMMCCPHCDGTFKFRSQVDTDVDRTTCRHCGKEFSVLKAYVDCAKPMYKKGKRYHSEKRKFD